MSTVMQPHTVYSKHKELLQLCYWKHNVNPTYGADLEHWTIIFGPVTTLERSPIVQQEEFRSLISALTCKFLAKLRQSRQVLWGCVSQKMTLQGNYCASFYVVVTVIYIISTT